ARWASFRSSTGSAELSAVGTSASDACSRLTNRWPTAERWASGRTRRDSLCARAPGRTTIEASKPSQTTWFGDMVSLVVVTDPLKQWKAQWTAEKKFRMNANPWASHAFGAPPVPGMSIQSELVAFKGSVDPDSSIPRDDFELGILQTVLQSRMVAV